MCLDSLLWKIKVIWIIKSILIQIWVFDNLWRESDSNPKIDSNLKLRIVVFLWRVSNSNLKLINYSTFNSLTKTNSRPRTNQAKVKTTAKGFNEASHHGTKHQPYSNPRQNFTISLLIRWTQNTKIIIII